MERCGYWYEGSSTEVAPPPERLPMPWKGRAGPAESSMWYADGVAAAAAALVIKVIRF